MSDALSHLDSKIYDKSDNSHLKLNALYVYSFTFIKIDEDFKAEIIQGYKKDIKLKNVMKVLKKNHGMSAAKISFERADNSLIFHINKLTDKRWLIIS